MLDHDYYKLKSVCALLNPNAVFKTFVVNIPFNEIIECGTFNIVNFKNDATLQLLLIHTSELLDDVGVFVNDSGDPLRYVFFEPTHTLTRNMLKIISASIITCSLVEIHYDEYIHDEDN